MARPASPRSDGRFGSLTVWGLLLGFPALQIFVAAPLITWGQVAGGRGWLEFFGWILVLEWTLFAVLHRDLTRNGFALSDVGFPRFTTKERWLLALITASFVAFVVVAGDSSSPRIVDGPWVIPRLLEEKLLMIAVAWTAGICEETIFRGYLYHGLRRLGRSKWNAVAITTAAFVMIHGTAQAPALFLFRAAVGLGFSGLYLSRGSLKAPILIHVLVDAQLSLSL